MFGHDIITRLILATLLPGFLVTCHQGALHAREYGYREPLHAGEYGFREPPENDTSLAKRTIWDLTDMTGGDKSVVIDAFADMSAVVNEVVNNPNPSVLQNYFDPGDADDVASVFRTIQAMIQPGGVPNAPNLGFGPTNLNQVRIRRQGLLSGCPPGVLAYSSGIATTTPNRETVICNFGWTVLFKRLRRDIDCSDIGPKINWKMQFLGPLLLHETLHFNNVGNIAWGRVLNAGEVIDDQPGSYPCFHKAYGPFESMKLRQRDSRLARLNNENYVWYALHLYWLRQCPGSAPGGDFIFPKSNDIPTVCTKVFTGGLASLWCWMS